MPTVGNRTVLVNATPTLSVAGAYSSGDYVGTSATPISFLAAVRGDGYLTGRLESIVVVDKAAQSVALELWLFDATITAPTDNEAWAISDADALKCLGWVPIAAADYKASSNNSVATVRNVGLPLKVASGTTLYGALVSRGTPTYTTGDLEITLGIVAD